MKAPSCSYDLSLKYLGVVPLAVRRSCFAICFMYMVLNNLINYTDVVRSVYFYVRQYSVRDVPLFHVPCSRTYYLEHDF